MPGKWLFMGALLLLGLVAYLLLVPSPEPLSEPVRQSLFPADRGGDTRSERTIVEGSDAPSSSPVGPGANDGIRVRLERMVDALPSPPDSGLVNAQADPLVADVPMPEHREEIQDRLQLALAGDAHEAVAVNQHRTKCRSPMWTESAVRNNLRVNASAAFPRTLHFAGEWPHFEDFESLERFMWQRLDECESTRGLFDEAMRQRLESMAQAGSITARYLYAVWPPYSPGMDEGQVLARLVYQENAMAFTWANIIEREPLGVLALAQSYMAGKPAQPMFTPVEPVMAHVLVSTVLACGMDEPWILSLEETLQGNRHYRTQPDSPDQMQQLTDSLKRVFC